MPKILHDCIDGVVSSGKSEDSAWAICISRLTKSGLIEKGEGNHYHLTEKGKKHGKTGSDHLDNTLQKMANEIPEHNIGSLIEAVSKKGPLFSNYSIPEIENNTLTWYPDKKDGPPISVFVYKKDSGDVYTATTLKNNNQIFTEYTYRGDITPNVLSNLIFHDTRDWAKDSLKRNFGINITSDIYESPMQEPTQKQFFVTTYHVTREYGGPEEGGWWYDNYEFLSTQPATSEEEAQRIKNRINNDIKDAGHSYDNNNNRYDEALIEEESGEFETKSRPYYSKTAILGRPTRQELVERLEFYEKRYTELDAEMGRLFDTNATEEEKDKLQRRINALENRMEEAQDSLDNFRYSLEPGNINRMQQTAASGSLALTDNALVHKVLNFMRRSVDGTGPYDTTDDGEPNATKLAEAAANEFNLYENQNYDIPELLFELSGEVVEKYNSYNHPKLGKQAATIVISKEEATAQFPNFMRELANLSREQLPFILESKFKELRSRYIDYLPVWRLSVAQRHKGLMLCVEDLDTMDSQSLLPYLNRMMSLYAGTIQEAISNGCLDRISKKYVKNIVN